MKEIFVPQLDCKQVATILNKYGYKLPENVNSKFLRKWHAGIYAGFGAKDCWMPLNDMGGIAIKAFHSKLVKFPKRIDLQLRKLMEAKKK